MEKHDVLTECRASQICVTGCDNCSGRYLSCRSIFCTLPNFFTFGSMIWTVRSAIRQVIALHIGTPDFRCAAAAAALLIPSSVVPAATPLLAVVVFFRTLLASSHTHISLGMAFLLAAAFGCGSAVAQSPASRTRRFSFSSCQQHFTLWSATIELLSLSRDKEQLLLLLLLPLLS